MLLNKYKVKSYTLKEFRKEFSREDMRLVEIVIDHLKENKVMYAKLVLVTVFILNKNINVYANNFESSLDSVGNQIMNMLLSVAKWACIGTGMKNMAVTMINGGNIRQATTEGIQYFIGYLFIQFYPQLFDLFGKIKF